MMGRGRTPDVPRVRSGIVTLLTDFGLADPFVGMMKGVIACVNPEAKVIDLTHQIPAQDVATGARLLERSFRYFPAGTVHLAVVDPGVGTQRRAIAIASEGHIFVGPDNGLLTLAAPRGRAFVLDRPALFLPRVSHTFHGRDVFAPAVAHLAAGVAVSDVGAPLTRPVRLRWPSPRRVAGSVRGEIVLVDRFGNLITNLEPTHWAAIRCPEIRAGDARLEGVRSTYGDAIPGALVAVVGGYGLLEIAVRDGSAQERLHLGIGDRVTISPRLFAHSVERRRHQRSD